jgi:hypothetical protein
LISEGFDMRSMKTPVLLLSALVLCLFQGGSASAQPLTPNQKFVNLAYNDLLKRPPSAGELNAASSAIDAASLTRLGFAGQMTSLPEFLGDTVNDYYQQYLGRSADTASLNSFIPAIQSGAHFEDVQSNIVGSAEYFARSGSTNSAFLAALYNDLLNRPIDASGTATFLPLLTGGTPRTTVANAILTSLEYRDDLVAGYFTDFLRRTSSSTERSPFVSELGSGGTDQLVIDQIISSQEYFNLSQTIPEPATISVICAAGLVILSSRHLRI